MRPHQTAVNAKPLQVLLAGMTGDDKPMPWVAETMITDLTLDSRQASAGMLFAAVPGAHVDGRDYINQALENGAAAVVFEAVDLPTDAFKDSDSAIGVTGLGQNVSLIASRLFDSPSRILKVVGITGTNGKTTCAHLIQQSLETLDVPCAVMGTLGASFRGETVSTGLTTADAVAVQRQMQRFQQQGAEAVCMEVSSHGLDQGRVNAVDFNVAVFTNLSQDHLDYHRTMDAYGQAKKKLFGFDSLDAIVVNADDSFGQEILTETLTCQVISYGLKNADLTVKDCAFDRDGITAELCYRDQIVTIHTPLFGRINLPNILATAATLIAMEFDFDLLPSVFSSLLPPAGRMEQYGGGDQPVVIVDYSHTPESLRLAIEGLRPFCHGRLWLVFGCGGDRDKGKRPQMGNIAADGADRVIITNDNPRSEQPSQIAADIVAGILPGHNNVVTILDRHEAIRHAISQATADDMILVAGKGHESGQTIGNRHLPFSDRDVVQSLLRSGQ